ncbi:uncharacterized protein LOC126475467 [Schistocerca serialis cubense]|uniref:uncharacterized protein LOC126475467 n=1 Tax=Schistocerca serialis cubense TaxID=2023355 RepID=UPI00214EB81C|nr:uncharacterized protein LOC126475467 [Schistocerca serialis cubense]
MRHWKAGRSGHANLDSISPPTEFKKWSQPQYTTRTLPDHPSHCRPPTHWRGLHQLHTPHQGRHQWMWVSFSQLPQLPAHNLPTTGTQTSFIISSLLQWGAVPKLNACSVSNQHHTSALKMFNTQDTVFLKTGSPARPSTRRRPERH